MGDETFGEWAWQKLRDVRDQTQYHELRHTKMAACIDDALRDHVRAVLGPMLERDKHRVAGSTKPCGCDRCAVHRISIHTAARALLGLPADAQSPLEDPQ